MNKTDNSSSLTDRIFSYINDNDNGEGISLKNLRKHLNDVIPSSIRSTVSFMTKNGKLVRYGHGVYSVSLSYKIKDKNPNKDIIQSLKKFYSESEIGADEYINLNDANKKKYKNIRNGIREIIDNNSFF